MGRRSALIDRDRERDQLSAGVDGPGVVIVAPLGMGKSALLSALPEPAAETLVLSITGLPAFEAIPWGALAGAAPELASLYGGRGAVEALNRMAGEVSADVARPTVVVDDLQWVDRHSQAVLAQLAADGEISVVAALDPLAPAADGELAEVLDRLELRPLGPGDVRALIAQTLGNDVDASVSAAIWQLSLGNPLLAKAAANEAAASRQLALLGGRWVLAAPALKLVDLPSAVRQRLPGLTPEHQASLLMVAFGEPLPGETARLAVGDDVLEGLEHLGLLAPDEVAGRRVFRLPHPVDGLVLRNSVGPLERRRLASDLAAAVDRLAQPTPTDLAMRARWLLDAGCELEPDRALEACDAANELRDLELAVRCARVAYQADPTPETNLTLSELLFYTGNYDEAPDLLARIDLPAETARSEASAADPAEPYLADASELLGRPLTTLRQITLLQRALKGMPDEVVQFAFPLQASWVTLLAGHPRRARQIIDGLLAGRSELAADMQDELAVLNLAIATLGCDRPTALAELAHLDPERPGGPPTGLGRLWDYKENALAALLEAQSGHLDVATRLARAEHRRAGGRDPIAEGWAAYACGDVELLKGRFSEASLWYGHALDVTAGPWLRVPLAVEGLRVTSAFTGDPALELAADDYERRYADLEPSRTGEGRAAIATAVRLRAKGRSRAAVGEVLRTAATSLHEAGLEYQAAEVLYTIVTLGSATPQEISGLDARAHRDGMPLSRSMADYAQARANHDGDALEVAARALEEMGATWYAVSAFFDGATAARAAGEQRRARGLLDRSCDLAARCDLRPELVPPAWPLLDLSWRERVVARRAAAGMANREIAAALELSIRTIENMLASCYTKLGVTDRTDLRGVI